MSGAGSTGSAGGSFPLPRGTVVITGAGGALCGTLARALGGIGMRIVSLDLREEAARATADAVTGAGGEALSFGCSVLDEGQLSDVYRAVTARWGAPDSDRSMSPRYEAMRTGE